MRNRRGGRWAMGQVRWWLAAALVVGAGGPALAGAPSHPFIPLDERPMVFAHRGGGGLEPESTVQAFENVQRHFPDAVIELDVHETRDGEIVVIHDDTVDRTTNGRGAVEKLTLSELQALDAGYCFSPDAPDGTLDRRACRRAEALRVPRRGRGYRIPTLAEVLTALRPSEQPGAPRSRLSVEVKSAGIEERVATLLRARWPLDRLAVGAIKGPVAARLAALLPEAAHYAPLANTACHLAQARAGWLPGDCARHEIIAVPAKNLFSSPALARYAHERGMAVASFTANDEATIERVIRRGVDAVITDFPDRAARVIQRLRGSQQGPQAPAAVVAGSAPAGDQPLRIDAHCHVFNGEDLALQGFVQKVILHEEKLYPGLLRPISLLVTSYVRLFADSYRQEARQLDQKILGRGRVPPGPLSQGPTSSASLGPALPPPPPESFEQVAADELAAQIESDAQIERDLVEAYRRENDPTVTRELAQQPRAARARRLAKFVLARWGAGVRRLTAPRFTNVEKLMSTYRDVDVFVPAMVDMDSWLGERSLSTIPEQIAIMAKLAVFYDGRLLPLVAYDPLRDEATGGQALRWVQQAIESHGFVGVKLYPPMGFRPLGNTDPDANFRPWRPQIASLLGRGGYATIGDRLEKRLESLYEWCAQNGVPIMAHVNDSNYSHRESRQASSPAYWERVLRKHPTLRVSFGHFGGMKLENDPENWARRLVGLLETNPNAYADLSNFQIGSDTAPGYFATLRGLLDQSKGLYGKLLYGSDWFMMSARRNADQYWNGYVSRIDSTCRRLGPQFFGENAVRYLGLAPGDPNRRRLETFYTRHKVSPHWLARARKSDQVGLTGPWECDPAPVVAPATPAPPSDKVYGRPKP